MANVNGSVIGTQIYQAALSVLSGAFSVQQATVLAAMVVAQSKNESANYTSNVFNTKANAFGYGYTGGSNYKDYTRLPSLTYGAVDVANWIVKRKGDFLNVSTTLDYAKALYKNDYFEGETPEAYAKDMQYYYVSPNNTLKVAAIAGGLVITLTSLYKALK